MMRWNVIVPLVAMLAGCAPVPDPTAGDAGADGNVRPHSRPGGAVPPASARTEADFDTTTPEEQAAARVVPVATSERALGTTVASLGAPSEPGFWLKTPLVREEVRGRVVYPANGRSVQLTLIPIDGPSTAGSRMSLSALRVLEAPLADLVEVEVFSAK